MKTVTIRIPITEHDLEDFKAVAYAKDSSEDFIYHFEAEDAEIMVHVNFVKEQDEQSNS